MVQLQTAALVLLFSAPGLLPSKHRFWKQQGDEIVEFVTDNDFDVLALKPEHDIARGDMTPAGYTLNDEPRPGERRGGGVAILCKANIKVKKLSDSRLILSRA